MKYAYPLHTPKLVQAWQAPSPQAYAQFGTSGSHSGSAASISFSAVCAIQEGEVFEELAGEVDASIEAIEYDEPETLTEFGAGASRELSASSDEFREDIQQSVVSASIRKKASRTAVAASLFVLSGVATAAGAQGSPVLPHAYNAHWNDRNEMRDCPPKASVGNDPNGQQGNEHNALEAFNMHRNKIKQLASLTKDWDGYGTDAPNEFAITWSQYALNVLEEQNLSPSGIVPSGEEGVGIVFRCTGKYADIEFYNSGEILGAIQDRAGGHDPIIWEIGNTESEIKSALQRIGTFLNDNAFAAA